MSRLDQVNAMLHQELAVLLPQYAPLKGGLVTITKIECSPDLRWANIHISVLPEKYTGTMLRKLRPLSGQLGAQLRQRIRMKRVPKFNWMIDDTAVRVAKLNDVFAEAEAEGRAE